MTEVSQSPPNLAENREGHIVAVNGNCSGIISFFRIRRKGFRLVNIIKS